METLVARYEQDLTRLLVPTDALLWLTIPGIGVVCAGDLYGELGSPAWFPSAKPAVKWAGLDPSFSQSGERAVQSGRMSREGNRWLRAAATQAAASVLDLAHHNAYFLRYAAQLRDRGKAPQPMLVAVANQCLHVALAMIRTHQVFAPPTWDGPPLAQDWRPKIPRQADRRVAEDTWSRLLQQGGRS
ncbi:MAG: transposase [Firmicutes bacterium]|nr:transposase [Bacillota bacterium]